jgi:hypothetical protein
LKHRGIRFLVIGAVILLGAMSLYLQLKAPHIPLGFHQVVARTPVGFIRSLMTQTEPLWKQISLMPTIRAASLGDSPMMSPYVGAVACGLLAFALTRRR